MRAEAVTRPGRIGRRALGAGLAAALVAPRVARAALPVPRGDRLGFEILRKGDKIGTHVMTFARTGADLVVTTDVNIVIYLGPIPVFRYVHHVAETWRDGRFIAADAHTNDDGTKHFMQARRTAGGIAVQCSDAGSYTAPARTLVATHWNRAELDGPMINPQGGKLLDPTVTAAPKAPIPLADGRKIEARRYALTGDIALDLWYDLADIWAATRFVASDKSVVVYRRV